MFNFFKHFFQNFFNIIENFLACSFFIFRYNQPKQYKLISCCRFSNQSCLKKSAKLLKHEVPVSCSVVRFVSTFGNLATRGMTLMKDWSIFNGLDLVEQWMNFCFTGHLNGIPHAWKLNLICPTLSLNRLFLRNSAFLLCLMTSQTSTMDFLNTNEVIASIVCNVATNVLYGLTTVQTSVTASHFCVRIILDAFFNIVAMIWLSG